MLIQIWLFCLRTGKMELSSTAFEIKMYVWGWAQSRLRMGPLVHEGPMTEKIERPMQTEFRLKCAWTHNRLSHFPCFPMRKSLRCSGETVSLLDESQSTSSEYVAEHVAGQMLHVIMLWKLWQLVLLLELYIDGHSENNHRPDFIRVLIKQRKRNRAYTIPAICARVCMYVGLHTCYNANEDIHFWACLHFLWYFWWFNKCLSSSTKQLIFVSLKASGCVQHHQKINWSCVLSLLQEIFDVTNKVNKLADFICCKICVKIPEKPLILQPSFNIHLQHS